MEGSLNLKRGCLAAHMECFFDRIGPTSHIVHAEMHRHREKYHVMLAVHVVSFSIMFTMYCMYSMYFYQVPTKVECIPTQLLPKDC